VDIWIKELPDGPFSRLTIHEGEDRFPRWNPGGEGVTFLSDRGGDLDVWAKRVNGTGPAELILDHDVRLAEALWGPRGEWLIVRTSGAGALRGHRDILGLRPGMDSEPIPLVASGSDEAGPALSPDGRLLAFQSDETGVQEVFVRPFPDVEGGNLQVSDGGGRGAVWAHNGEELFYVAGAGTIYGNRALMRARIRGGLLPAVLARDTLFAIPEGVYMADNSASYQITRDDQRFLMVRLAETDGGDGEVPSELILVRNFFQEVKELLER
jgi:Tol biopolymer transport system component